MRPPRFRLRTLMIAVDACIVPAIVAGPFLWLAWEIFGTRGVMVHVVNETGGRLSNVRIAFTGGVVSAPSILPHAARAWRIQSKGESDLALSYEDGAGQLVSKGGNVYIESGYRGSFEFHIRNTGIGTVDRIRSGPHPGGLLP
jgi:hypothetical protein